MKGWSSYFRKSQFLSSTPWIKFWELLKCKRVCVCVGEGDFSHLNSEYSNVEIKIKIRVGEKSENEGEAQFLQYGKLRERHMAEVSSCMDCVNLPTYLHLTITQIFFLPFVKPSKHRILSTWKSKILCVDQIPLDLHTRHECDCENLATAGPI